MSEQDDDIEYYCPEIDPDRPRWACNLEEGHSGDHEFIPTWSVFDHMPEVWERATKVSE